MTTTTPTRTAKRSRATMGAPSETTTAVALYARVSTEDQAERETIASQVDFLRKLADAHGWPIAGEYLDDGVSGTVPFDRRPEGARLLVDADAGRFRTVVFMRVSRLGRKLTVVVDAHDRLAALGVDVRSGTEPIDTATPIGRLLFQMLGSFAEFDRETISENTTRGRNRVAAKGRYVGGPIPVGYDVDDHNCLIESTRLVPQLGDGVTEADMVREVFTRIASGESTLNAECRRLTALGVPRYQRYGGEGGKVIERDGWVLASLAGVLHNPVYKGEGVLDSRFGEIARPTPALIDAATWDRVQVRLIRNRNLAKKNAKHVYLLRGLVRCRNCGVGYAGIAGGSRGARSYRCNSGVGRARWRPEGRCIGKQLPADWLEAAVWEECRNFILNPGPALDEARRKLRDRMAESTGFEDRRRAVLAELATKENERERVLKMYRKGKVSDDEAERELDAIAREAGQLRELLESLRAQAALIDAQEAYLTESTAMLGKLREELAEIDATNDLERKRDIIDRYVRCVEAETRRVGVRKLEADLRVYLRLEAGTDCS